MTAVVIDSQSGMDEMRRKFREPGSQVYIGREKT